MQPCKERKVADRIIKEALKAAVRKEVELAGKNGKSLSWLYKKRRTIARNTIKLAVYLGGWTSWNKNKKDRKKHFRSLKTAYMNKILPGERWSEFEYMYGEKLYEVKMQVELVLMNQELTEPKYCMIFSDEW